MVCSTRATRQSRITGIQYLTKWNRFKANFAVFNGWSLSSAQRFGARPAGIRYLRQNQMNIDDNSNKALEHASCLCAY